SFAGLVPRRSRAYVGPITNASSGRSMQTVHLANRAVIQVAGPDAEHFLQNIVTTDLGQLGRDEARPGALLSPQGKILFDFLISRAGDDLLRLDLRDDAADDFVRRLMLSRLRAKAEISKQDQI